LVGFSFLETKEILPVGENNGKASAFAEAFPLFSI
jgi:hypothetical protein